MKMKKTLSRFVSVWKLLILSALLVSSSVIAFLDTPEAVAENQDPLNGCHGAAGTNVLYVVNNARDCKVLEEYKVQYFLNKKLYGTVTNPTNGVVNRVRVLALYTSTAFQEGMEYKTMALALRGRIVFPIQPGNRSPYYGRSLEIYKEVKLDLEISDLTPMGELDTFFTSRYTFRKLGLPYFGMDVASFGYKGKTDEGESVHVNRLFVPARVVLRDHPSGKLWSDFMMADLFAAPKDGRYSTYEFRKYFNLYDENLTKD